MTYASLPDHMTTCNQCQEAYTDAFDKCPNGCIQLPVEASVQDTEKPKQKAANSGLTVVQASKPAKPASWTSTSHELAIPIMEHGVLIHYIRQGKRDKRPRAYYYGGHWHSILELWFWVQWQKTGYPMPTPEYRFHPERQWKLDFAWTDLMICVELEGGAYTKGRHTRGVGFKKDIEKYNEVTALGWQLYRFADTNASHIEYMKARLDNVMQESEAA